MDMTRKLQLHTRRPLQVAEDLDGRVAAEIRTAATGVCSSTMPLDTECGEVVIGKFSN